jgi:hypothetical protein
MDKNAKAMAKFRWKIVRPFSTLLLSINLGIMFSRYTTAGIQFSSRPYEFINAQNVSFKRCCNKLGYNSGQFMPYTSRVWSPRRCGGSGGKEEIHLMNSIPVELYTERFAIKCTNSVWLFSGTSWVGKKNTSKTYSGSLTATHYTRWIHR